MKQMLNTFTKDIAGRNSFVDVIRGVAMLLVVLGHTMTGCTIGSHDSLLYNVIWSLQMPLFILVSGYVTRYSRGCYNRQSFLRFVWRRSWAYLLPLIVWTFAVRGFICGQSCYLNPKWVVFNMDSGYWFLFTIWTISMYFGIAEYIAKRLAHSNHREVILTSIIFIIEGGALLVIGKFMGWNFLCIKLTLYYMSFYWLGYIYGKYRDVLVTYKHGETIKLVAIAVCFVIWLYFISNIYLFNLPDNGISVIIRVICSLTGCIAVCGLCKSLYEEVQKSDKHHIINGGGGYFLWAGVHSLEIYLGQYLVLNILKMQELPMFMSIQGLSLTAANFLLTMALLHVIILLTNQNKYLRFVLYGKR